MLRVVVLVGRVEQGLGRDAANVEASTTKSASLLDADGLKTFLSGLDSSNVT